MWYNDIYAGLDLLFSNSGRPTSVIIKHANPCGVSSNKSALKSFSNAHASDPVSAFGGIVACNYRISNKIALEINKTFFEVILAKSFENKFLKILKNKKNMIVIDNWKFNYKSKTNVSFLTILFFYKKKMKLYLTKKN